MEKTLTVNESNILIKLIELTGINQYVEIADEIVKDVVSSVEKLLDAVDSLKGLGLGNTYAILQNILDEYQIELFDIADEEFFMFKHPNNDDDEKDEMAFIDYEWVRDDIINAIKAKTK